MQDPVYSAGASMVLSIRHNQSQSLLLDRSPSIITSSVHVVHTYTRLLLISVLTVTSYTSSTVVGAIQEAKKEHSDIRARNV
jgi:hypothetical protein